MNEELKLNTVVSGDYQGEEVKTTRQKSVEVADHPISKEVCEEIIKAIK